MMKKYNEEENKDLDKGWAWVVMAASSLAGVLNGTLIYCAGVVHVALLQKFQSENVYTSFIGALYTSLLSLMGPLSSILINMFNCRFAMVAGSILMFIGFSLSYFVSNNLDHLLITYGIIAGSGLGLCATPPLVVIGYFFHVKRGLALAIVTCGAGLGLFIAGPVLQFLIKTYGLQGAFLVLAGISSHNIIHGLLMKPTDLENRHKKDLQNLQENKNQTKRNKYILAVVKNIFHFDILADKAFMFNCVQFLFWNIPFSIILLHLPNYAVLHGSSKENAALLLTYTGITSMFGRVVSGLALGHNGLDPVLLNFGLNAIAGILTLSFPIFSMSYKGKLVYALMFGLYGGGLVTLINPLCMELIGVARVSSGVGIMYFIGGIGYFVGPPIAGLVVDKGGTYEQGFIISGSLFILAAIFTLVANNFRMYLNTDVQNSNEGLTIQTVKITQNPDKKQVEELDSFIMCDDVHDIFDKSSNQKVNYS